MPQGNSCETDLRQKDTAAEDPRPPIPQKAGGLQGLFCYAAFAPTRGIGAFIAINQFEFGAAAAMASAVNDMIAALAPR
jgi:D-alanyl-D-alanine-carboxypeptidase/D-alanyl-D-alanine-endopeptidase